ncbi:hypothetical protein [Streptomyces sp. NL15-2K]|uniref:hypothetical protein n=1 Tax=Streptomyces sp. NL15-2K TaxID=376149 RepID=UPI000F5896FC|nr:MULTISPECIES: hypothetical protein [Actinomycetes]WKX10998.1 hypothetical protein Q4V64_27210 [Kutzneria buriramensis]
MARTPTEESAMDATDDSEDMEDKTEDTGHPDSGTSPFPLAVPDESVLDADDSTLEPHIVRGLD